MTRSESLQTAPERAMQEAVRVKPQLQQRPQDVGDDRNMEHLPRKAIGNEWNQPKRSLRSAGKAIGTGLLTSHL